MCTQRACASGTGPLSASRAAEQLPGGMRLETGGAFPLSLDTMVLADFVRLRPGEAVCDLGCGGGALALLLCGRDHSCRVTGVELQAAACGTAEQNIVRNGLAGRCRVLQGDLREIRRLLPQDCCTHAVSNPPYFSPAQPAAPAAARAAARSEQTCTLSDLCAAAAWVLRRGGRFSLVYRPERLCDLICALRAVRLEPKRLRFVRHRPGARVSLVLLEARAGGGTGLACEPDLILYDRQGALSPEGRRVYHCEGGA